MAKGRRPNKSKTKETASEAPPAPSIPQEEPKSESVTELSSSLASNLTMDSEKGAISKRSIPSGGGDVSSGASFSSLGSTSARPSSMASKNAIPAHKNVEEKMKARSKEGRPIKLAVNHFPLRMDKLSSVHRYNVIIRHEKWKKEREARNSDKPLFVRAFEKFKIGNPKVMNSPTVFDGKTIAFSPNKLNLGPSGNFQSKVTLPREDDGQGDDIELIVEIQYNSKVDLKYPLEQYMKSGRTAFRPNDAIQVINIILNYLPTVQQIAFGRNVFPDQTGQVVRLGGGRSMWQGIFSSFRPAWKLFLNVDMANKPAYEENSVIKHLCDVLGCKNVQDLTKALQHPQGSKVAKEDLKGIKVRFNRPDGHVRDQRVCGLGPSAMKPGVVKAQDDNKKAMSIADYFYNTYQKRLVNPQLPTLHVGNPQRDIYWPMELVHVKKQACPNSKRINEEQTAAMIRHTAIPPANRRQMIAEQMSKLNNCYASDPFAQAFGISIDSRMAKVDGRVLDAPIIGYGPKTENRIVNKVIPGDGKWMMGRKMEYLEGRRLDFWAIINFCGRVRNDQISAFINKLYEEAHPKGLYIEHPTSTLHSQLRQPNQEEASKLFERAIAEVEANCQKRPQLIMAIIEKGPIYSWIKHLGDVKHKIPSQCVLFKNVVGRPGQGPQGQTMQNINLKINSKLMGVNQVLFDKEKVPVLKRPVMLVGADVTHAMPGAGSLHPSIAAVVASYDPAVSRYNCEIRFQEGGQAVEEIRDMETIMKNLLLKFYDANRGRKPEKIIMYRDGVSEGQFETVLALELSAIQRACLSLEKGYQPGITFMVAQKRHKTRLFVENPRDGVGKGKNVPPGTVVDSIITHPTEEDFFLASHEGIQGTTKPTHYHRLWDDNNFNSTDLQRLTYYLCHMYSRCQRSVSYPAPTYYAHLAAFRAREHHKALIDRDRANGVKEEELGKNPEERQRIEAMNLVNYFV